MKTGKKKSAPIFTLLQQFAADIKMVMSHGSTHNLRYLFLNVRRHEIISTFLHGSFKENLTTDF